MSYHLHVFDCEAFFHVPNDEKSKLDAKTQKCIFIGYDHNEFGYKLYDSIKKKLVRIRDVVFFEDQTIKDIDETKKTDPQSCGNLIETDLVPLTPSPNPIHDDKQEDNIDDQRGIADFDAPMDKVENDQHKTPIAPPIVPPQRPTRD